MSGMIARCATPTQKKIERQPASVRTAARMAIMMSCPTHMPDSATELARPVRPGKARVTITPTGIVEAMPLPIPNTIP
jgi:hypothetical protein